jgi:hypothetical protein
VRYSCLAPVALSALLAACVAPASPTPPQCAQCRAAQPEPEKATGDEVVRSADDAKCRPYGPDGYAQCRARLERQRIREILLQQLHPKT